ncbi:MAG TPA: enoyl-CoA hydratase-related protein [Thermoleophilaceae bacterium]|jgi:enoyl-CoA hydratase|nr:enoyl-CoA hydratase-related protein [Thermoleophilaceae bacterium]
MAQQIGIERTGDGVALLSLNAPERRNALTVEMAEELVAACEELDADAAVGAVVVRGEGGFFCAGGDRATLEAAGRDPADPEIYEGLGAVYRSFARVGELRAPTVAAVRGGAVGAGLNLMLATDVRIVARDARVISGFIPIGLHPGGGHGALLGRTGAREAAAAMALFGERIDGERAAKLGLAWAAVDDADVEPTAIDMAARAGADPELARRTTASLRTVLGPPAIPWPAALELERASQMWSMRRKALGA